MNFLKMFKKIIKVACDRRKLKSLRVNRPLASLVRLAYSRHLDKELLEAAGLLNRYVAMYSLSIGVSLNRFEYLDYKLNQTILFSRIIMIVACYI